ncbi:hypothetical protein CcCBS67573_g09817 [Chytriomyces confervae]|uniref:Uncharacterized protein n=1 Tax=Chytriomyces confervae TaxID=246404 RepID=A0A507DMC5_9FUNG|nr:hypothetical protein CcCBS67573_g09817 [Chytriomyces confervae]
MKVIQHLTNPVEKQHTKVLDVRIFYGIVPGGPGSTVSAPLLNPSGSDFASLVSALKQSVNIPATIQSTKVAATFSGSNHDRWQEFDAPTVLEKSHPTHALLPKNRRTIEKDDQITRTADAPETPELKALGATLAQCGFELLKLLSQLQLPSQVLSQLRKTINEATASQLADLLASMID